MRKSIVVQFLLFFLINSLLSQTSWKGTTSTNWKTTSNWTAGVPNSGVDAIIGDVNFTGAFQPVLSNISSCKNLTIGNGSIVSSLSITRNINVFGNITIGSNGTILSTTNNRLITLTGNWLNNGGYSATSSSARVVFSGASQSITGATTFTNITVGAGSTVTLAANIVANNNLTVSGTLNPTASFSVSGTGTLIVNSTGVLKVETSTFAGNYNLSGAVTLNAVSTVNYSSASIAQTVSSVLTYGILRISGGSTKSLSANLPALNSTSATSGAVYIDAGIFDLLGFTAGRGTTTIGGSIVMAAGTTLKIGGTNTFPANYTTKSMATTSTVEYNGANQTVLAAAYGNLTLSGSSGAVVKTMPGTAMTIAGNLTASLGTATGLNFTAAQNITVNGSVTIGSSCVFDGASFVHLFSTNWTNNGTFTGSTSTTTFAGISALLSGSGTNNFNNLVFTGVGISGAAATAINVSGNLSSTGSGTFAHAAGGTVTLSGASKTISGIGFVFSNLIVSGSLSSATNFYISGNFTNNGTFSASAGTITMDGNSKTISGSGTPNFFALSVLGTISTAVDLSFLSNLAVSLTGSLSASGGTAIFNGTSNFTGTANFYNVTINSGKSLSLGANSSLGIAAVFTKTGTFTVTASIPNTVVYNGTATQAVVGTTYHNLIISNTGAKTLAAVTVVNNDLSINTGATLNGSSLNVSLYRHWNNAGTFNAGTSTVTLFGTEAPTITGVTTFNNLTVNKASTQVNADLASNINVTNLAMTSGNMATLASSVTITGTRTGNGLIVGTIIHSHSFSNGVAYSFEGPHNLITFTSPSGITSVTVKVTLGEISDFNPALESVNREYEISIPAGTYTDATFRYHYLNNELNAFVEPLLAIYKFNSGVLWDSIGFSSRDTALDYVEKSGITSLPGRYSASGTRNILRWDGSTGTNWNNASNWTTVSGSPLTNRVPLVTDAVYIGDIAFSNQPSISTTQQVSVLRFGSVTAVNLTISGGSLSTAGSIKGQWGSARSHILDVGSGTLLVGTDLKLSDSINGHDIHLKISSGNATVTAELEQSASGAITFSGSGSLVITGNYNYSGGTFTAGTGTVNYSGADAQVAAPIIYYNLSFSKSSERANLFGPTRVNGNLSTSTGGEIAVFDSLNVAGNITIGASTTLLGTNSIISIGGNWLNNGNYLTSNGTLIFNGSGAQSVNANTFNKLVVNKSAGSVSLTNNLVINSEIRLESGTLDLVTYAADRVNPGGTLYMATGSILKMAGANNFPNNFITHSIHANSNQEYNGSIAQNVLYTAYGNLTFSNGGSNAKTLLGNITVNGNFQINTGATFNEDIYFVDLFGNFTNSGTFNGGSGALILDGVSKTITGSTTVNHLYVINGSYTVSSGTITMTGDLIVQSSGSINFGSNNASLDGNFINYGTIISNGTATFTGTRVQTISLVNAISSSSTGVINFNGTVSPVINSSSSPSFATVNINNTAGITASVPWFVFVDCNIAAGATFNGGPLTHTFYKNFTNNGTVTSSGLMKFRPGAPYSASGTVKLDGVLFSSTGTVEFGGSGSLTLQTINPFFNVLNITNTNVSGVTAPASWTINDDLDIATGATFYAGASTDHLLLGSMTNMGILDGQSSTIRFGGNPVTINGLGTSTFNHLKIVAGADLSLNRGINIQRNLIVDGTFAGFGRTVNFTGTTASVISGSAGSLILDVVEHSKIGSTTTLSIPLTITGELTLTDGKIISTASNLLIIDDGAISDPGNATSFISGPMKKIGNDSFVFPLGKRNVWARLGISSPSVITDEFTAEYFDTSYSNISTMAGSPSPVLNKVSQHEYWICNRVAGSSNVMVKLYWEDATRSGIHDYSTDLVVARWNGTGWENNGHSAIYGASPGHVTSNTVTAFSPFAFGSILGSLNVLPITLVSFEGKLNTQKHVELKWSTSSEINNAMFTIERSQDGRSFNAIDSVEGAWNSNTLLTYYRKDLLPLKGISYYRLKQTDLRGKFSYSKVVVIRNSGSDAEFLVYPNPTTGMLFIELNSVDADKIVSVKDIFGKTVLQARINSQYASIDLSGLANGIYFVHNGDESFPEVLRVIKK